MVLPGLVQHWTLCTALCSHSSMTALAWCTGQANASMLSPYCTHRSLIRKGLHSVQLLPRRLQTRMTMARTLKLYKLPDEPLTPGIRALERRDIAQASLPGMCSFPSTILLSCSAACSS